MKKGIRFLGAAVATVLGAGYSPFAPGTVASLISASTFYLLMRSDVAFDYLLLLSIPIILVAYWGCIVGHRLWGKDPSRVTIDEFAGCWITCLFAPASWGIYGIAVAFTLFRLFDILKPWPVSKADEMVHPSGILLDDIAAGLIAGWCILLAFEIYGYIISAL